MIVPRSEIELINSHLRRRMMRFPADVACPVRVGHAYRLRTRQGEHSVIITITDITIERLSEMSTKDARFEGYGSPAGAIEAFLKRYRSYPLDGEVYRVSFVKGDERGLWANPVYLRSRNRDGTQSSDYTTRSDLATWGTDGPEEVEIAPGAAELARVSALAKRQEPLRVRIQGALAEVSELQKAMLSMKSRNRARLIEHQLRNVEKQLNKLQAELPVSEIDTVCPASPANCSGT